MNIKDILRTRNVKRWHIVNTRRVQTLAEHSYCVTMIAMDLATKVGIPMTSEEGRAITGYALLHDLSEVLLGDFPSPVKVAMRQLDYGPAVLEELEKLASPMTYYGAAEDTVAYTIVKLADILEAITFLQEECDYRSLDTYEHRTYDGLVYQWLDMLHKAKGDYPSLKWRLIENWLTDYTALIPATL